MKIRRLDQKIYRKIAAGEVVERPASVVKELVENSIDAKASKIIVEVEKGGIEKIKVTDDGTGIEKEDMSLVFEHHATSKIGEDGDLFNIRTMGFRGEALSSISAISNVNIISKTKDSPNGYFYAVSCDKFQDKGTKPFQDGTSLEITNLFFNVPARQKFLKTPFTEFLHITRVFTELCLANTGIAFKLTHNGKDIYNLAKAKNLLERVEQLFGKDLRRNLLPIFCAHPHIKISGFIGKPQAAYDSKLKQFILVNNRSVKDRVISSAVREGFGSLVMGSTPPLYFIDLTVPFDFVDVNVHPRKEEVKFVNSNLVYSLVKEAVFKALAGKDLSFRPSLEYVSAPVSSFSRSFNRTPTVSEALEFYSKLSVGEEIKVLPFNNLYILAIINDVLEIYDQHALHERILYEKLKKERFSKEPSSQILLAPQTLEVSENDFQVLTANAELLKSVGFEVAPFGERVLKISAVPSFLGRDFSDKVKVLKEFAEDLQDNEGLKNTSSMEERALFFMACRFAIKAGDVISSMEALELVREGYKLEGIYTCPHGRPFKIKVLSQDLEKMFKRS